MDATLVPKALLDTYCCIGTTLTLVSAHHTQTQNTKEGMLKHISFVTHHMQDVKVIGGMRDKPVMDFHRRVVTLCRYQD